MANNYKYFAWNSADIYPCEKSEASFVDIDAHEYEVSALRERLAAAEKVINAKDMLESASAVAEYRNKYEGVK